MEQYGVPVYIVEPFIGLLLGVEEEFDLGQIVDCPQHFIGPRQGILGDVHVDLVATFLQEFRFTVLIGRLCFVIPNVWEGLFDGLPEVLHPGDQIQERGGLEIGELLSFGSSNLFEDFAARCMGNAGRPKHFQGPMGGETRTHLVLDKADLGCQVVAGPQNSR